MPQFKSTYNILKKVDADEVFETSWMDRDQIYLPPTVDWDYQREMQIEDVDIWEVLYQQGGSVGVYAAWCPYAEFYMITLWGLMSMDNRIETYYGPDAEKQTYERALELGIPLQITQKWVDDSQLWLHNRSGNSK